VLHLWRNTARRLDSNASLILIDHSLFFIVFTGLRWNLLYVNTRLIYSCVCVCVCGFVCVCWGEEGGSEQRWILHLHTITVVWLPDIMVLTFGTSENQEISWTQLGLKLRPFGQAYIITCFQKHTFSHLYIMYLPS
jgi:hypothetical protein